MADVLSDRANLVRLDGKDDDVLRTGVAHFVEYGDRGGSALDAVFTDDTHSGATNRLEIRASRDERHVFTSGAQPTSDVSADRSRTDDRYLHASLTRFRSGLRTRTASSADRMFIAAVVMNTPSHPNSDAAITLLSGTRSEATPFAVYNRPALADAYRLP